MDAVERVELIELFEDALGIANDDDPIEHLCDNMGKELTCGELRTLLALARSNSWQTIETAPKDGTEIIIGWLKDGAVRGASKAKWVSADFWADLEGGEPDEFVAGWYEPNYEDELCANVWIPLPSPPDTGE